MVTRWCSVSAYQDLTVRYLPLALLALAPAACGPVAQGEVPARLAGVSTANNEAAPGPVEPAQSDPPASMAAPTATPSNQTPPSPSPSPKAPSAALKLSCPTEMALVRRAQSAYCIDRYEGTIALRSSDGSEKPHRGNKRVDGLESKIVARSVRGKMPQGYISGKQAAVACERAGKRLCENDEWVTACRGSTRSVYPYGDKRRKNICNDRYRVLDKHPVVRLFKKHAPPDEDEIKMWHPSWMNDPRLHQMSHSVVPTGAFAKCTNDYGVFDMVGNLHEWVADPAGVFFGGYLMDTYQNGEGCDYRTIFHPFDFSFLPT